MELVVTDVCLEHKPDSTGITTGPIPAEIMAENTQKWSTFFQRNKVLVVMVPLIIGLHFGWGLLQGVERFVSKEEKEQLPFKKGIDAVEAKIAEIEKKMGHKSQ